MVTFFDASDLGIPQIAMLDFFCYPVYIEQFLRKIISQKPNKNNWKQL